MFRVMVALTVMLVMASLQSSIQDSLPKTAYFKVRRRNLNLNLIWHLVRFIKQSQTLTETRFFFQLIDYWILMVLNSQVPLS